MQPENEAEIRRDMMESIPILKSAIEQGDDCKILDEIASLYCATLGVIRIDRWPYAEKNNAILNNIMRSYE